MKTLGRIAVVAAAGAVLGACLQAATALMASAGPVGDGWSFRGNGALVVPIGFGAALLAGGWLALFLYARGAAAWAPFAVLITAAAATPATASIVVLLVFGSDAQRISDLLTVPAVLWPILTLAFVAIAKRRPAPSRRLPLVWTFAAAAVLGIALGVGFFAAVAFVTAVGQSIDLAQNEKEGIWIRSS